MREFFFILLVIFVLLGLTAFRFRRQIFTAVQFWRMLKQIKNGSGSIKDVSPGSSKKVNSPKNKDIPLVKCLRCGTWKPQDEAVVLGGTVAYCSSRCVELSVQN